MIRPPDADYGRLSTQDRVLVVVCEHPGLTASQIGRLLGKHVPHVSTSLTQLRRGGFVAKQVPGGGIRWWPTSAGRARMLETRRTFEAAVAVREHA